MSELNQDTARNLIAALGNNGQPAAKKPLATDDVIAAIYAVGAEAARRGEMFPQTDDEQLEDRHAVARVAGMLRWYEKNTGCARLRGWPAL